MSSATAKRQKNFKSKIPVPVLKVKSFNESEEKKEMGKHFPSIPKALSYKSAGNPFPLKKDSKTQLVKPPLRKINKRNDVGKSLPLLTQLSNKTVKNYTATKVKSFKENKPSNKANKDMPSELLKKVTIKNSVKEETKKSKLLANEKFQSSNASFPTCNVRDVQIEDKLVQKNDKLCASQNILEKENQEQSVISDFPAQKGIKFEGNEIFRQMILRGRDMSPSLCRLAPGVKLSSVSARRESAYDQVFEVSTDPHRSALQAIEKMSAKRGNRKLTLQIEKMPLSPYKMRNSLYTPGVNPEEEVMKCLEAIRAKRIVKSALKSSQKKVTFNLDIEDFSAKVELSSEQKSFTNSEDKLTQINEASSENTPSSPVKNHCNTNDEKEENCLKSSKLENLNEQNKSTEQSNCYEHLQNDEDSEMNNLVEKYLNILSPSETNNLLIADSNKSPIFCSKKISSASLYRNCNSVLRNEAFSCQKTIPQISPKFIYQSKQRNTKMKLCTPRPVSFSSNSRLLYKCSPDFLEERNVGNLSNLAPIYTPLVLRNIAKHSAESPDNLSPVKLKLDFAATESDTPKKEIPEKMQVSSVKNIVTATKMLDSLADKECDIFLSNENSYVICGRYLRNPVALTLTEGDEMHFLPIRL